MLYEVITQKNLTYSIPAFMILGLIYGSIFNTQILKLAILPLTFVMVYPMMVNLNIKKVFSKGDGKLQWVTQLINFIIVPLIGFSLGEMFFSDEPLVALGLLLVALIPTSGMTVSWTGFAKGNMEAAIKMTVIGLVLGSVLIPFYLQGLMGTALELPMFKIFSQILMVIFLPMLAGYITQQLIIKKYGRDKYQKNLKQIFPPISTLGVVGIVFVAMALKAKAILTHPEVLLEYALPLLLLYGLIFFITTIIGKYFFSREDSIALA